ncbi:MAG: PilN domain-containing protein [Elusimicrobia bacterium]|nr:PilN domain-containing protein [Elusimicrobiota bacterium]
MIKINLLPVESVPLTEKPGRSVAVAAVLGVFVAGSLGWYLFQWQALRGVNAKLLIAQRELEKYEDIVRTVEQLEREKGRLEMKRNVIRQLDRAKLLYPVFMERFIVLVPRTLWLTSLNTTPETDGLKFTLDGFAPDHFVIADFLTNLEGSRQFSNVELGNMTASTQEQSKVWQFRVTGTYRSATP